MLLSEMPPCGVHLSESIHGPGFCIEDYVSPFHKILYVYRGEMLYHEDRRKRLTAVPGGTFLPVPMGRTHTLKDVSQAALLLVRLTDDYVRSTTGLLGIWSMLVARKTVHIQPRVTLVGQLERVIRRVLAEQMASLTGRDTLIQVETARALVALCRVPDRIRDNTSRQRVGEVIAEIEETFYLPWTLDKAAEQAQLSPRRFSGIFKEITNATFLRHLTEARLAQAAALLEGGQHTVSGAAFLCGFGDITHFYRLFKSRFGMSPKRYMLDHCNTR